MSSTALIGLKESNCCSVTGLAEAKARKSISASTKATKKFVFSRRVQTRFMAARSLCSRRNIRSSILSSPRSSGLQCANIASAPPAKVNWNAPIFRKKKPAYSQVRTRLIRRTTKRFRSGSLITFCLATGQER